MQQDKTKEIVYQSLKSQGRVSGRELAQAAGVSRNAVWKQIKKLQQEGYPVQSAMGQGYTLHSAADILLPLEIKSGLQTNFLGQEIVSKPELDSTQKLAKSLALDAAPEGLLVLTEKQSKGRGRMYRSWVSPAGNIYMSCVLRPALELYRTPHLPLLTAVAVSRALYRHLGLNVSLKWPNDLLYQGRKLGGILAEVSAEADRIDYLLLGLGLNVNMRKQDFSPSIMDSATALGLILERHIPRVQLLQEILYQLENMYVQYLKQGFQTVRQAWLELNCTLGQEIQFVHNQQIIKGIARDMHESGGLLVSLPSGQNLVLHSGDIQHTETG